MKHIELLSPAGDMERLQYALLYGADAVYLGTDSFGMRNIKGGFQPGQMAEAVKWAHGKGKKVYLTMNTIPTNAEADALPAYLRLVGQAGFDAVIVADLGVLSMVKKQLPHMEIHISTQAGVMNWATARACYEMGAKRVVLARELNLEDIKRLRDQTPPELEIEAFCHGAMCMSISGRCLLSRYLNGRDGNRGKCAQPCRWQWQLSLKEQAEKKFDIYEEENGSYLLNADDLCTAPFLDKLIEAGVDSLKIEGRAKSFYYVASVTAAYRRALDNYLAAPQQYSCPQAVLEELEKSSHRRYSPGFYLGDEKALQNTESTQYLRGCEVTAVVEEWENGVARCIQRGKCQVGDTLEVLLPQGNTFSFKPAWLYDIEKDAYTNEIPRAMMPFLIPIDRPLVQGAILRRPL